MSNQITPPTSTDNTIALYLGMIGGPGAMAEFVERDGQNSATTEAAEDSQRVKLPFHHGIGTRENLEDAGVRFLEGVEGDSLFMWAELPAGWSIRATDHALHSDVLDEQGRKRAHFMYKAAAWDRDASLSSCHRYRADAICDDYHDDSLPYVPAITDSNHNTVWRGTPVEMTEGQRRYQTQDIARSIARAKLHELIPRLAELQEVIDQIEADESLDHRQTKELTDKAGREMCRATWEADPVWPEWESQEPAGEDYVLHVVFSKDGQCRDSGDHAQKRAETAEAAIEYLMKVAREIRGYDVQATIRNKATGDVVHRERIAAPTARRTVLRGYSL